MTTISMKFTHNHTNSKHAITNNLYLIYIHGHMNLLNVGSTNSNGSTTYKFIPQFLICMNDLNKVIL